MALHLRINLLAQVWSTAGYTHGRPVNNILQIVNGTEGRTTMSDLAEMYRVFLWEAVVQRGPEPIKQLNIDGGHASLGSTTPAPIATDTPAELGASGVPATTSAAALNSPLAKAPYALSLDEPDVARAKDVQDIKQSNTKAVRSLVQNLARVTTPLFQGK